MTPLPLPRFSSAASLGSVHFCQHVSPNYTARTLLNAKSADLTVACAADYSTAGERLTERLASEPDKTRYLRLPLYLDYDEAAERLIARMRETGARSLNIAGNGIYTLQDKGWTQEGIEDWMSRAIALAHAQTPISFIVSGGQTGADMAGALCAAYIGVPAVITLPKGFVQRGSNGFDAPQNPLDLAERLKAALERLSAPAAGPKI